MLFIKKNFKTKVDRKYNVKILKLVILEIGRRKGIVCVSIFEIKIST